MFTKHSSSQQLSIKHRLLNRAGLMLLACIDLYVVGLILYFLVRLATGFHLGPVALVSNFLHLALLPALLLLPIVLACRQWRRVVLVTLPVLAFLWLYGELFVPSMEAPVKCGNPDCVRLTVMTFNLGDGGLDNGSTEVPSSDIMRVLIESGTDVAGFQEVTAAQAEAMQRQMSSVYPYFIAHEAGTNVQGIALLSRYPIVAGQPFYGTPKAMPNLDVALDVQGHQLHMLVAHPPPPGWSLNRRLTYYSRAVDEVRLYADMIGDEPAILLGDMNSTDQSEEYIILTQAGLFDAYREAGFGFGPTFPSHKGYGYAFQRAIPLIRLDYVFHTQQFETLRAWVGPDIESDHLPVLAELAWQVDGDSTAGVDGNR